MRFNIYILGSFLYAKGPAESKETVSGYKSVASIHPRSHKDQNWLTAADMMQFLNICLKTYFSFDG